MDVSQSSYGVLWFPPRHPFFPTQGGQQLGKGSEFGLDLFLLAEDIQQHYGLTEEGGLCSI